MTTNIDILMDLDPLSLTADDPRIGELILYYRRQRTEVSKGKKPEKETGPKLSLEDLGLQAPKPALNLRRI